MYNGERATDLVGIKNVSAYHLATIQNYLNLMGAASTRAAAVRYAIVELAKRLDAEAVAKSAKPIPNTDDQLKAAQLDRQRALAASAKERVELLRAKREKEDRRRESRELRMVREAGVANSEQAYREQLQQANDEPPVALTNEQELVVEAHRIKLGIPLDAWARMAPGQRREIEQAAIAELATQANPEESQKEASHEQQ